MNILVTGGAGYVGSHAARLLDEGIYVIGFSFPISSIIQAVLFPLSQ